MLRLGEEASGCFWLPGPITSGVTPQLSSFCEPRVGRPNEPVLGAVEDLGHRLQDGLNILAVLGS